MVSQRGHNSITTTLTAAKATQASTSHCLRSDDPIPDMPHRLDDLVADLLSQAPDAHLDDVAPRVERQSPDVGQQLLTSTDVRRPTHQMLEEQILLFGQVDRTVTEVDRSTLTMQIDRTHAVCVIVATALVAEAHASICPRNELRDGERLHHVVGG